ncbi:MAG: NosD domain-containing protein, partial [Promethearchaeota archaeon]
MMRTNTKIILTFLISLTGIFSVAIVNNHNLNSVNRNITDYDVVNISAISGKIHIDNNWTDAKTAGICTGEGTESDPYVIEDYEINGGNEGSCILIENAIDYFLIKNCTLSNAGSDFYDAGIKIISANNGNLSNNIISNPNSFGIVLFKGNDNNVYHNILTGKIGISVRFSNSNVIYFNSFISSLFNAELHNSTDNRWSSSKKMRYIYNTNTYTSYLGNYWSVYNGLDNNNNGIGDEPVIFDQHLPSEHWQCIDYYPLMS